MEDYKKRNKGKRERKRVYVLVCDDSKTSPTYFKNFNSRNLPIRIEIPKAGGLDPLNLIKYAKKILKEEYGYLDFKNGDALWCIFDRDDIKSDVLLNACQLAEKSNIRPCLSNPCFEVWYLLHFVDCNSCLIDCQSVIFKLNDYIPSYEKRNNYFNELEPLTKIAITRSKKLLHSHKQIDSILMSKEAAPSTHVHNLVEILISKRN